ncbi:alpha/beta fold hydrolase [Mameliella alba]|nr:alpha/beta fold hydrolase [Antarctobacter heliothermus]MBY6144237.1 alpha/beta fold hydrolase [Mameliella alba]MBY6161471.1 alpha/beta fold hydrolase [Mameliella alba]MBY6170063.1 alpha/beta fold hydrolase [Mameliella alba]MBY6174960.1 alpha/beta fold hydrolase [Mameliella alba]
MVYRFADCTLDPERHRLTSGGAERHVEPQVFALLDLLLQRAGEVVSRDDLIRIVWKGRIVSDATVDARISAARSAVGDDGHKQAIIRTVPRVGLQLVVPVERVGTEALPFHATDRVTVRMATSADGSGIAWSSLGKGPPLMRAGHWMTHQERDLESPIWRPWLDRLGRGRRLVRYDPRGTGMSDRDCGGVSEEKLVEDMEAVADAAGLERFSIFAASQSASVACIYAARHPERIDRLILYGGFTQGSLVRDGEIGAAMTQAFGDLIRKGWGQENIGAMRSFSALFMPQASEDQIQSFIDLQVRSASPDWAAELREVCARVDVTEVLPKVIAPVLVAHARNDALQPFSQAQRFARLLPDAQLLSIDSANHVLVPDEPGFGRLMDAVDDFLARQP